MLTPPENNAGHLTRHEEIFVRNTVLKVIIFDQIRGVALWIFYLVQKVTQDWKRSPRELTRSMERLIDGRTDTKHQTNLSFFCSPHVRPATEEIIPVLCVYVQSQRTRIP